MIRDDAASCSRQSCSAAGVGSSSASRTRTELSEHLRADRRQQFLRVRVAGRDLRGVALHRLDSLRERVVGVEPEAERADESDGQRDPDGDAFAIRALHEFDYTASMSGNHAPPSFRYPVPTVFTPVGTVGYKRSHPEGGLDAIWVADQSR